MTAGLTAGVLCFVFGFRFVHAHFLHQHGLIIMAVGHYQHTHITVQLHLQIICTKSGKSLCRFFHVLPDFRRNLAITLHGNRTAVLGKPQRFRQRTAAGNTKKQPPGQKQHDT